MAEMRRVLTDVPQDQAPFQKSLLESDGFVVEVRPQELPELARILRAEPGIDFVQLGYSLAARAAEAELLPIAAERGVAVIANQPLERGNLFRRVHRHALPDWAREADCANWAELFLKYVLAEPAVTCVIPATGNPDHMKDNLAAGFGALPDTRQREQIRELWDAL